MFKPLRNALVAVASSLLILACAIPATTLNAQWVNPEYSGKKPVRDVMVMSASRDSTNRRLFEDRMVAALTTAGVKAVPSYRFIPEEGPATEDRLRRAVADSGVSHAMVTRISNVSTQVNVSPGMVMGPSWGPGWGPGSRGAGWGGGWGGFHGYHSSMWVTTIPPQVTTSQDVHADTRLFETKNAAVMWSAATTTSLGFNSVPDVIDQFVQLIVTTMTKDGVI